MNKYPIGTKVSYVGSRLANKLQYGGELTVWQLGKNRDFDKCACLTKEGKVSTWIEYIDLEIDITPSVE